MKTTEKPRVCPNCQKIFTRYIRPSSKNGAGRSIKHHFCGSECAKAYRSKVTSNTDESFWKYVNKTDSCWIWVGPQTMTTAYGFISIAGKRWLAHRYSFHIHNPSVELTRKTFVCHTCDNPSCVNPEHLFLGSANDNNQDMVSKKRHSRGSKHPNAKLKEHDVINIRDLYSTGLESYATLAEKFSVSRPTIARIINGLSWKM